MGIEGGREVRSYRENFEARETRKMNDKAGHAGWKFMDFTGKVFLIICTFLLFVLVADVFAKVLTRYVFKIGLIWPDEVARLVFIVTVFLGSAICVRQNSHFAIDLMPKNLPKKFKYFIQIFIYFCIFVSGTLLLVTGLPYSLLGIKRVSYSLGIPLIYVFVFIPISGAFMILSVIERFIKESRKMRDR
jgi:TRAP-type C4-dicarboxylate transport system permease small subunit